jgi:geranyl diphosphate synthase
MQVLLLMATALNVSIPQPFPSEPVDAFAKELRARQQCIAEITEMIHVSSLEFCASIKCFCAIFC